jgi:hypothetical protein
MTDTTNDDERFDVTEGGKLVQNDNHPADFEENLTFDE